MQGLDISLSIRPLYYRSNGRGEGALRSGFKQGRNRMALFALWGFPLVAVSRRKRDLIPRR